MAPDEKSVANYYDKTTAMYCPAIASTLVLHSKASVSGWLPLLHWTQSVISSGYAIMHGELRIKDEKNMTEDDKACLQRILVSMDPKVRQMYEKMKEPPPKSLATWEFKSLTTGSDAVIGAVGNIEVFPWAYCKDPECKTLKKHERQRELIAGVKVGPDAQKPPWNLNVSPFTSNLVDHC